MYSHVNGVYYGNHRGTGRNGNGINYPYDPSFRGSNPSNADTNVNGNIKASHPEHHYNNNDQGTFENTMQLQTNGQIESKKDAILYSGFDDIGEGVGR
jgi:hypothetical protein